LPSNHMSAPAKSATPVAPAIVESKDWTKATTPELLSGSKDESSVLDAKAKECRRCKQVRREERQRREAEEKRACEEAERKAREEVERVKVEAERKAREEVERKAREQAEKERAESQARVESQQRKAAEEAAKQRAVEVAAKQKTTAQEVSKKRAREEPEAGPVSFILNHFCSLFFCFYFADSFCRCVRCAVCERDLEKPKQRACMKCASLKEKCEWPEVGGPGPVVDKGKGKAKEKEVKEKEAVTSP